MLLEPCRSWGGGEGKIDDTSTVLLTYTWLYFEVMCETTPFTLPLPPQIALAYSRCCTSVLRRALEEARPGPSATHRRRLLLSGLDRGKE